MLFCGYVLELPQNLNMNEHQLQRIKIFLTKNEIKKMKNNLTENDTHRNMHIYIH